MMTSLGFLIRDGLESDISACLQLDHHYESDHVWQMTLDESPGQWQVSFKIQRLPRILEATYPASEARLRLALPAEHCFLVAAAKEDSEILGYLTMRNDPVHRIALVQDVVVSRPYRRQHIGTRLLSVARQWAKEHHLLQVTVESQTQNYPGITFCQQNGFVFCGFNDQYFPDSDIAVFFGQSIR
jgi:GNAT superfamily N-acetyltransferase